MHYIGLYIRLVNNQACDWRSIFRSAAAILKKACLLASEQKSGSGLGCKCFTLYRPRAKRISGETQGHDLSITHRYAYIVQNWVIITTGFDPHSSHILYFTKIKWETFACGRVYIWFSISSSPNCFKIQTHTNLTMYAVIFLGIQHINWLNCSVAKASSSSR